MQPRSDTAVKPAIQPAFSVLPNEIKDSIYKHAVADACLHIDITPRKKTKAEMNAVPSSGWCGTMRMRQRQELEVGRIKLSTPSTLVALLLTSRQINHEVHPHYAAAIEKLVIRCAGIGNESGYGCIGGFDGGGVYFHKVSKAIFTPSRKLTPVLRRLLTLRKATHNPAGLLARIENVKMVVIEHWDPYVTLPTLERFEDSKQRIHKAVSISAYGDAFWEWISSNKKIQCVVVRWKMMEPDKEKRIAVSNTSMEVAWDMKVDPLVSPNIDGPLHNLDTRWQIINDPVGGHGSHGEEGGDRTI